MLLRAKQFLMVFILVDSIGSNSDALLTKSRSVEISTLQLAQVIFRHGDRNPFASYPTDPYNDLKYWPEGWGQLTKRGKVMQFDLGKYLQWRYSGFLSNTYSRSEVYVQSSETDRTMMSAQVNLAGLFPPDKDSIWNPSIKWQPIPVHTIPMNMDRLIRFGVPCPRYTQLFEALRRSAVIQDVNNANKDLYGYLSQHTGQTINDYRMVADLYDLFFIERLYNRTLPEWTASVFPDKMKQLALLEFQFLSYTDEMKKLSGGSLLADLIKNMDFVDSPPKQTPKDFQAAKLRMYSGHDTTISALLSALGLYDKSHIPPYAAAVLVELHKAKHNDTNENEIFFVRLFYRNDTNAPARELQIPGCVTKTSGGVCTLKRFKTLLDEMVVKDWDAECGLDLSEESPGLTFYNRISMATAAVFFALVVIMGCVFTCLGVLAAYTIVRRFKLYLQRRKHMQSVYNIEQHNEGFQVHL